MSGFCDVEISGVFQVHFNVRPTVRGRCGDEGGGWGGVRLGKVEEVGWGWVRLVRRRRFVEEEVGEEEEVWWGGGRWGGGVRRSEEWGRDREFLNKKKWTQYNNNKYIYLTIFYVFKMCFITILQPSPQAHIYATTHCQRNTSQSWQPESRLINNTYIFTWTNR